MSRPSALLAGVVIGTPDPRRLASFYEALLGYTRVDDEDEWVRTGPADRSRPSLGFQLEERYVAPVWPPVTGAQQMMLHLDIGVDRLEAAVARAVDLGAEPAVHQPQDNVRVLFDPDGHPFCLFELG